MTMMLKPDWNSVNWIETPDRVFFSKWNKVPVVKIVCRERTYILPACLVSQAYRDMAIDIIEHETGEQRGIVIP